MSADAHPESTARMVDVSGKAKTDRIAVAECLVVMGSDARSAIAEGKVDKGDVLEVARVAGIMGAKRTPDLVPLCHPIALTSVQVDLSLVEEGVAITVTTKTNERTGVEMEALTGAAIAALTVYDMVKGIERGVEIAGLRLREKSGGASGDWSR